MMGIIKRVSYRLIELGPDTQGETIGVFTRSGEPRFLPWRGFIQRDAAIAFPNARPVRIIADRYCQNYGTVSPHWIDIDSEGFIQGCMTPAGVYAVTVPSVRILPPG